MDSDNDEQALLAPALAVMTSPATLLMANPMSLNDVWNEYLHGVGGGGLQGFSPKLSEGGSSLNTCDKRFGTWFGRW